MRNLFRCKSLFNRLRLDVLFHTGNLMALFVVVRLNMFEGLSGLFMSIIILEQVAVGVNVFISLYINRVSYIVKQAVNDLMKSFKFLLRRGARQVIY
jgi:hypothetical protein